MRALLTGNRLGRVALASILCALLYVPGAFAATAADAFETDDVPSQARDITAYFAPERNWFGSTPRSEIRTIESVLAGTQPNDEDWIRFSVTASDLALAQSYLIEAVGGSLGVDPVIEIYGPVASAAEVTYTLPAALVESTATAGVTQTDPLAFEWNDDGIWFERRSSSVVFIPEETGSYYVRVRPYYHFSGGWSSPLSSAAGSYTLRYKIGGFSRLAGADRLTTAIEVSQERFPVSGPDSKVALLANAYSFPDALSGSTLAGAVGGPVLLCPSDKLPSSVRAELVRLGVTKVYILGGTKAISVGVASAVDAISGVSIERIGGANRAATARLVAREAASVRPTASLAFVVNADRFPDALAASPMATYNNAPVLLTNGTSLTSDTRYALTDSLLGIDDVVIVGGTAVVSSAVESQIKTILGGSGHVRRIAGSNRYQTARNFAVWATGPTTTIETVGTTLNPTALETLDFHRIGVASGEDFPDALAGGVFCGLSRAPILLTGSTELSPYLLNPSYVGSPPRPDYYGAAPYVISRSYVIGGSKAVSTINYRVLDIFTGPSPL